MDDHYAARTYMNMAHWHKHRSFVVTIIPTTAYQYVVMWSIMIYTTTQLQSDLAFPM